MFDENPDEPHDVDEDASYAEFRINFNVHQHDEEGMSHAEITNVESHVHHIPDHVVVDALLILAKSILGRTSVQGVFSDSVPDEIREPLMNSFVTMLLKSRLDAPEVTNVNVETMVIPNDISELLGD